MSNMTRYHLQTKTARQLTALFRDVTMIVAVLPSGSPERKLAQSLLAMIQSEHANRRPSP